MNNTDGSFYKKLIDLYAGSELPTELENDLIEATKDSAELQQDMMSLRNLVNTLHQSSPEQFSEEIDYRIQMKIQNWGENLVIQNQQNSELLQFKLPMEG